MSAQTEMDVKIRNIEAPIKMVGVLHTGPYIEIGKAFEKLNVWLMEASAWPHLRTVAGIYHDDPTCVAPEKLRSHACAVLQSGHELDLSDDLEAVEAGAGKYAVLRFKGPYAGYSRLITGYSVPGCRSQVRSYVTGRVLKII